MYQIKTNLKISAKELAEAKKKSDHTIEKIFGDTFVQITVFGLAGFTGNKLVSIKQKMQNQNGLNKKEIDIAIKAGLIDKTQQWFWAKAWQKAEKQTDHYEKTGHVSKIFNTASEGIKHLHELIKINQK